VFETKLVNHNKTHNLYSVKYDFVVLFFCSKTDKFKFELCVKRGIAFRAGRGSTRGKQEKCLLNFVWWKVIGDRRRGKPSPGLEDNIDV
jgi:hypothetical protein